MPAKQDLFPGTLDMLVLLILTREELHDWGVPNKLEQLSRRARRDDLVRLRHAQRYFPQGPFGQRFFHHAAYTV